VQLLIMPIPAASYCVLRHLLLVRVRYERITSNIFAFKRRWRNTMHLGSRFLQFLHRSKASLLSQTGEKYYGEQRDSF
jgi:hypothetical protein